MKYSDRQLAEDKKASIAILVMMLVFPILIAGSAWAGHKLFGPPAGWFIGLASFGAACGIANLLFGLGQKSAGNE